VNIYDDDNDNGDIDIYSYPPICMPSQGEVLNSSNSGAFVGINNKISMVYKFLILKYAVTNHPLPFTMINDLIF